MKERIISIIESKEKAKAKRKEKVIEMTKQNFKVEESNRTIIGDIATMTNKEREHVQMLCSFGYTFIQQAQAKKTRKSATKKMAYYKTLLYAEDYSRFEKLCSVEGISYSKCCSWANTLVEMAKAGEADKVEDMRKRIDYFIKHNDKLVDCFILVNDWKAMQKPKKQRLALSDDDKAELGIEDELAA